MKLYFQSSTPDGIKKLNETSRLQVIDSLSSDKLLTSTLESLKKGKEQCIIMEASTINGIMNRDFSETSKWIACTHCII